MGRAGPGVQGGAAKAEGVAGRRLLGGGFPTHQRGLRLLDLHGPLVQLGCLLEVSLLVAGEKVCECSRCDTPPVPQALQWLFMANRGPPKRGTPQHGQVLQRLAHTGVHAPQAILVDLQGLFIERQRLPMLLLRVEEDRTSHASVGFSIVKLQSFPT